MIKKKKEDGMSESNKERRKIRRTVIKLSCAQLNLEGKKMYLETKIII